MSIKKELVIIVAFLLTALMVLEVPVSFAAGENADSEAVPSEESGGNATEGSGNAPDDPDPEDNMAVSSNGDKGISSSSKKSKISVEGIDIKLTLNAKQVDSKAYKNVINKFKVKFTAKWDDENKYNQLISNGWSFSYKLVDQDNKVIYSNFSYEDGYTYVVTSDTKEYKLVATAKKGSTTVDVSSDNMIDAFTFPDKPVNAKAKCPKKDNTVTFTWKAVSNAAYYYVYRSKKSKKPSKPYKKVSGTKFKDQNLSGKQVYRYYVQAVYEGKNGGNDYATASSLSKVAKVTVNKFLTQEIKPIKWKAITRKATKLYKRAGGGGSNGRIRKGTKVQVVKKVPKVVKQGHVPRWIKVKVMKNGKAVKTGWIRFSATRGVRGIVAYKNRKALDWGESKKVNYVNKKKYSSKTKYLIWVSTYTQRVNIFKGKTGKWKLIKSHRCVTGTFYQPTSISSSRRIVSRKPRRVRNFLNSTSKYYYTHLSFFAKKGGPSFHTVCWALGTKRLVNRIKPNCQPGTKGCVRCPTSDAKWIYKNIPLGTKVVVY